MPRATRLLVLLSILAMLLAALAGGGIASAETAPVIDSLSPEAAEANGPDLALRVYRLGATLDDGVSPVVLWNDVELLPLSTTISYVDVIVPNALLVADEQFSGVITVPVRVRHGGVESNALPFTIIGRDVGDVDSAVAGPGGTAFISTAPTTFGGSGLRATLSQGDGSATLTAANYTGNPTGTALADAISFVDLQYRVLPTGPPIQPESSIAADFYLPPSPIHGNVCQPSGPPIRLHYWSGAAWLDVLGSGSTTPAVDLTEDLDGTRSCGSISATFDVSSSPSLAGLGGTVFAIVQEAAPPDTTPPTLHLPDDLFVDATGPGGAVVSCTVSASDDVTATPAMDCQPSSGAAFAIGVTPVHCTATDAAGNATDGTFQVRVLGASEQLANLIADVEALTIKPAAKGILLAHLVVARIALHTEHPRVACLALRSFIQQVDAYSGKWLSAAQAAQLRADAQRIRTVIGC